jgi:hypothetical protein
MVKVIFLYLIMLHLLGDFYIRFQFSKKPKTETEQEKGKQFKDFFSTNLSYLIVFSIGSTLIWSIQIFLIMLALSVLHFITQLIVFFIEKHQKTSDKITEFSLFIIGQVVSITLVIITTIILKNNSISFILKPWVKSLLDLFSFHGKDILKWLCILLIIHKPTNIVIKQLLKNFKPSQQDADKSNKDNEKHNKVGEKANNAGAFIGTLERIIIALLLSTNQYSAIGLVLTAKSIARYEKITKDKDFAEYYLLGTLLSTLIIIGVFLFFNSFS